MTVRENLLMGAYRPQRQAGGRARISSACWSCFRGCGERIAQRAGTLSGGEQQMVAMARALMGRPRLICMDEPTMGLSPLYVDRVLELIAEINRQGTSVFMVEQNASPGAPHRPSRLCVANRAYRSRQAPPNACCTTLPFATHTSAETAPPPEGCAACIHRGFPAYAEHARRSARPLRHRRDGESARARARSKPASARR